MTIPETTSFLAVADSVAGTSNAFDTFIVLAQGIKALLDAQNEDRRKVIQQITQNNNERLARLQQQFNKWFNKSSEPSLTTIRQIAETASKKANDALYETREGRKILETKIADARTLGNNALYETREGRKILETKIADARTLGNDALYETREGRRILETKIADARTLGNDALYETREGRKILETKITDARKLGNDALYETREGRKILETKITDARKLGNDALYETREGRKILETKITDARKLGNDALYETREGRKILETKADSQMAEVNRIIAQIRAEIGGLKPGEPINLDKIKADIIARLTPEMQAYLDRVMPNIDLSPVTSQLAGVIGVLGVLQTKITSIEVVSNNIRLKTDALPSTMQEALCQELQNGKCFPAGLDMWYRASPLATVAQTAAIVPVTAGVVALNGQVAALQGQVTALNVTALGTASTVTALQPTIMNTGNAVNNLGNQVNNINRLTNEFRLEINNDFQLINENITNIENAVNNQNDAITNIDSSVGDITSRVTNIDSSVGDITSRVTNIDSSVGDITSRVTNIDNSVGDITSRVTNIDNSVNNQTTAITNIDNAVNNQTTAITNIDNAVNNITSRISDIDANVSNITSVTNQINNTIENNTLQLNWVSTEVETVVCEQDNGVWTPRTIPVSVQVLTSPTGDEIAKVQNLYAEIAKSNKEICLAKNNKQQEAYAVVPEWWQVRSFQKPQLVIQWAEVLPDGKLGKSRWALTIPHYNKGKEFNLKLPDYEKGEYEAIKELNDNSKLIVNASNEAECLRIINILLQHVDQRRTANTKPPKVGKREGTYKKCKVTAVRCHFFATGQQDLIPTWSKSLKDNK